MEQLFGYIERIVYRHPETGFTVARLKMPKRADPLTVVGTLMGVEEGVTVRLVGQWKKNPTHGMQFEVNEYHIENPTDLKGIQKYLESGMVRGIGPVYAERIVKKFAEKTLDIIDQTPERLLEISGIGPKRIDKIRSHWQQQRAIRQLMLFLQKHGISAGLSQRIYKYYGEQSLEIVQENPFSLARDIRGIGFKTADAMAEKLGISKESTQRIDAAIEYILLSLADEGHTCYPKEGLKEKVSELLGGEVVAKIPSRLEVLTGEERLVCRDETIWIKRFWLCEQGIGRELKRLLNARAALRPVAHEKAIDWVEEKLHLHLARQQREAVKSALIEKMLIITGGPGTGKSTITRAILTITAQLSSQLILAAPTGRAAKRMSEITGRTAHTIHSLLQFDFNTNGFKRNRNHPLECDLLIVDEASMIDTSLMYRLLQAIPDRARLILIGDIHQLPSVGPGNVLKDLIESRLLPVVGLTEIFRQAAGSRIIVNAHRINRGEFPDLAVEKSSDFFFLKAEEAQQVIETLIALITERLPTTYQLDPIQDIQVLAPMKRGPIGIDHLNAVLQQVLNPQQESITHGGMRFSVHDKVMQIRNDYTRNVYNGDVGIIQSIDKEEEELCIVFDEEQVVYSFTDLDALTLAYVTSVHKYQGSECRCVIVLVHTSYFTMLRRNLLYTAVTRGKELVILIGNTKAIAIALSNDDVKRRHTGLQNFLVCDTLAQ